MRTGRINNPRITTENQLQILYGISTAVNKVLIAHTTASGNSKASAISKHTIKIIPRISQASFFFAGVYKLII